MLSHAGVRAATSHPSRQAVTTEQRRYVKGEKEQCRSEEYEVALFAAAKSGSTRQKTMPPTEPIMRRASTAGTLVKTPTPLSNDVLTGSLMRNVSRLEESAEQMSMSGSDLGDEIRRIASAGSRRSRENSIQSSRDGDITVVRPGVGQRYGSSGSGGAPLRRSSTTGSRSRYRGQGNGYVGSPIGSVHPSLHSHASTKSSRLAQASEPTQEGRPLDSPMTTSFQQGLHEEQDEGSRQVSGTSFGRRYDEIAGNIRDSLVDMVPSSQAHHNEGMRRQSQHFEIEGTATPPDRPRSTDTYQEAQLAFEDFDGVHFSPETDELVEIDQDGNEVRRVSARNSSGVLSIEAASLLRTPRARPISYGQPPPGQDMVYYPAPVPRMLNLPKRLSQQPATSVQAKRRSQMLAELPPEARAAAPWLPPLDLEGSPHNRNSGMHAREASGSSQGSQRPYNLPPRRASGNFANLPPQLRSSAFFDHPSVQHDVEVHGGSAVATLDNILAASATAPVRAFTDHPYAGDVAREVYSPEPRKVRNSTSTVTYSPQQTSDKKKRSSSIGTFFKRTQSSDQLDSKLEKRASHASLLTDLGGDGGNKLKKRRSVLSLGDELDRDQVEQQREADGARTPDPSALDSSTGLIAAAQNQALPDTPVEKRKSVAPTVTFNDDDQIQKDFDEEEVADDVAEEDEDPLFVQPSTLLAELQVRKAQLKSRNRTAATAFPTGMHSTLLQLDAVEEINKRKRQKQRIALAWEDPHQRALEEEGVEADEDVPLGMLFPGKEGRAARRVGDGKDWDRPLGLMEKREMEDNEPLSSRRNRLQGNDSGKGRPPSPYRRPGTGLGLNTPQLQQDAQPDAIDKSKDEEEDSEHEGETLAQRMRRMRTKDALDGTIAHIETKDQEENDQRKSGFTEEWASQFGNLDVNKDKEAIAGADKPSPALSQEENVPEDETLGQRRARLQREAAAGGSRNTSGGDRPPLRSSTSLANLLALNPTGQRNAATSRAHTAAAGTLLHTSAQAQARAKSQLVSTNMRSSSYALDKPLVNAKPRATEDARGMLANEAMNSRAATGGFGGGLYSNGAGGANVAAINAYQSQGMGTRMSGVPMVGTRGGNGVFASPTAGYFGNHAQPQMQMGGYVFPYQPQQQQMGYPMQMNMGMGQYPMQMQHHQANPYGMIQSAGMPGMVSGGWGGNAQNPGMMGGTYASFAQTGHLPGEEGYMGEAGGGGVVEGGAQPKSAIERWRMGVAGQ